MFGRKKTSSGGESGDGPKLTGAAAGTLPLKSNGRTGTNRVPPTRAEPARADGPRRVVDMPSPGNRRPAVPVEPEEGKKLIVGRDISLSGEITACDTLVVEGTVEAQLAGSRKVEIAEGGLFKGSAQIEAADISGRFEGDLAVSGHLYVRETGRVTGKVRYATIKIDTGGEISGDVETGGGSSDGGEAVDRQQDGGTEDNAGG